MMTMATIRKFEVVNNEVEGCLVSYNIQLAFVRKWEVKYDQMSVYRSEWWIISQSVTQSFANVGIELLWQLKKRNNFVEVLCLASIWKISPTYWFLGSMGGAYCCITVGAAAWETPKLHFSLEIHPTLYSLHGQCTFEKNRHFQLAVGKISR